TQWQLCLNNDQNNLIAVNTNPFTLEGLTQETHYTVKVRDCHEEYNGVWSDAVDFTTLAYCAAPTDLAVDEITRLSATLSWNADSDSYKVFYRTTGEWVLATENLTENTFTFTGLSPETHYEAYVKGVCNGIESNASGIIGFTTLLDNVPTLTVSGITYTSAGLSWTETPGANSYEVSLNNSTGILVTSGYTPTDGTVTNENESYSNLVDNNKNSKWFVNTGNGSNFTGCYIEFCSQHDFVPTGYVLTTANDTDTQGTHPGRNPKTWAIMAKLHLEDPWTVIESVTDNYVMQNVPLTDYEFTLDNNTPYRYFRFEVLDVQNSSNHRFQLGEMRFLGYSKNSVCLTDLEPATTYSAKVRAKVGDSYGEWSDEISFNTFGGLGAPTLTVSNVASTSADLNWTENPEAIGYTVSLNDAIVSFPSQIITGYTATSGAGGYNTNEGYAKLVDNDRSTKWCRKMENVYIEFHSESRFVPTGYILTTGSDNATAHGRNPKDWVIKAKLKVGDPWTTIATVTNDNVLQDVNTTDFEFAIDNHLPYRYFRFEVSANQGNDSFQLGEFRFLGYVPTNSLHLADLLPDTDYSVKVRSDLGASYSDWSNTVDFRTLIQSPTNLTVTDIDYTSATLGWAANSSITQWQICLNGDEDHLILTDANPYTLTGLNPHTHYTVKVRNCQEGADDAWSDEVGFTTPLYITPPTLTVSDISQTSVVLNWTEISGVDGYTISVNDAIIPDPIITGYTATSGAGGYNTNEGYANLVDNDRNTKWCRSSSGVYIEFHSQQDFVPTGYVLTTANDTHKNPQRNPKNWVIKAKLNAGDPWTLIATVTNDQVLQDVNTTDFEFAIDNSATYRYFRFEVSAVQSGDSFQLGELRFRGLLTSHSLMLADLQAETDYAVKVRAYSGETISEWSNVVNFTTWPNNITFIANGYWNDAANWNINQVPGVDDEVFIAAQAVVPAGYVAQVQNANVIDGGSITIEDGGQFIVDNMVKVAMQKSITKTSYWGGGDNYTPDNWYFITSPVNTEDSDYSVTGLITEGEGNDYDFYRLNGTIWENYKADDFDIERCRGYLYASENGTEIEFGGNAIPYSETSIPLADGFNLVGNPYTFNTFINRPYYKMNADRTDIELVNDNTAIAPCEGVLVDVEGTDQVTFTKTNQMVQSVNNGNLSITVLQQASNRGAAAFSDKAIVSFNAGRQLGKFYFKQRDANIYIPQDGKDYAIVCTDARPCVSTEIPLHFKATKIGRYTIRFGDMSLYGILLIDKIENVTIDLGVENEYTFLAAPNDRKDRFVLLFDPSTGSGTEVFAYQNGSDIIVTGEGELNVFDVMGRMVMTRQIHGVETCHGASLQTGVYIFILNGKTQKIVVR
ncbi:MAG: fibronectin type III domain-containing protein, partial [Bacteroidales bacterium]|nr:fibronectin type III domain-containing protein [Bacteroidales bacterium]